MSDKILCEVSDLTPLAEAVRNAENKTDLYSLKDLSLKASALLANGSSDEFLDELNAVNGTASSTMADAVDNTETLVGSQTDLITQIATALEGKVAGGGSGSDKTCTVTVKFVASTIVKYWSSGLLSMFYTTLENGVRIPKVWVIEKGVDYTGMATTKPQKTIECVCGTSVFVNSETYSIFTPSNYSSEIKDITIRFESEGNFSNNNFLAISFTAPDEPGEYLAEFSY